MSEERVASVTLPTGAVITSEMTSQERFNAHLKAFGAPTVETPQSPRQWHTDATVTRLAQGDASALAADMAAVKWTPAKPAPVVPQSTPEDRAKNPAAFEPPSPVVAKEANQPYMQGLLNIYQDKLSRYDEALKIVKTPAAKSKLEKDVLALKVQFQKEYAYASEGGQQRDYGKTVTPAPSTETTAVAAGNGWVSLAKVDSAKLSGYTLPKLVENQEYHDSIYGELAVAKAAGFTQEQVNSYIAAQMRRDGWIK